MVLTRQSGLPRLRARLAALALALAAGVSGCARTDEPLARSHEPPARAEDVQALLQRLAERREAITSISVAATAEIKARGAAGRESAIRYAFVRGDRGARSRLWIETRSAAQPTEPARVVEQACDGATTWRQAPTTAGPIRVTRAPQTPADAAIPLQLDSSAGDLSERLRSADAAIVGRADVAGQPCAIVEVSPRRPHDSPAIPAPVSRYWLSETCGMVLRSESAREGAPMRATFAATRVEIGQPIADSDLAYAAPAGAFVVDLGAIREVLDRAAARRSAYRTLYVETETAGGYPGNVERYWQARDGATVVWRRERSDEPGAEGGAAVLRTIEFSDAAGDWLEQRSGVDVQVRKFAAGSLRDALGEFRARLEYDAFAELRAAAEVDGVLCDAIAILEPVGQEMRSSGRLFIGRTDGVLRRYEAGPEDAPRIVSAARRVVADEPIDPAKLAYAPPAGVEVDDTTTRERQIAAGLAAPPASAPASPPPALTPLPQTRGIRVDQNFTFSISPDDRWLLFISGPDGAAAVRVVRLRDDQSHEMKLADDSEFRLFAEADGWVAGGRYFVAPPPGGLLISSTGAPEKRRPIDAPYYIVDFGDADRPQLIDQRRWESRTGGQPRTYAQLGAARGESSDGVDHVAQAALLAEKLGAAYGYDGSAIPAPAIASRDGRGIFCQKRLGRATALLRRDVASGAETEVTRFSHPLREGRIDVLRQSPDGRWLAVVWDTDLFVVDLREGATTRVGGAVYYDLHWTSDSQRLFFYRCVQRGACGHDAGDHVYALDARSMADRP